MIICKLIISLLSLLFPHLILYQTFSWCPLLNKNNFENFSEIKNEKIYFTVVIFIMNSTTSFVCLETSMFWKWIKYMLWMVCQCHIVWAGKKVVHQLEAINYILVGWLFHYKTFFIEAIGWGSSKQFHSLRLTYDH